MFKLFAGTANQRLSKEIANELNYPLSKAEVVRFGNSEVKVTIQEDVKDAICAIVQPTSNPTDTNLVELLFFADALKRSEAKKIIAVIPYFGYARQNAQHRQGECVSMSVVIKMLESAGIDEIIVTTLHEEASSGMFSVPFKNLDGLSIFVDPIQKYIEDTEHIAIVTPDQEGVERARTFAKLLSPDREIEVAVTEKRRDLNNIHQSQAMELYGNVDGKICMIVDDIITSGGTVINSAHLCLERGAKKVLCAITHADFNADSPEKLQNSSIEKFFASNTILLKEEYNFPKLSVHSVASLLANSLMI